MAFYFMLYFLILQDTPEEKNQSHHHDVTLVCAARKDSLPDDSTWAHTSVFVVDIIPYYFHIFLQFLRRDRFFNIIFNQNRTTDDEYEPTDQDVRKYPLDASNGTVVHVDPNNHSSLQELGTGNTDEDKHNTAKSLTATMFMLGIAYSSNLGGTGFPTGTGPNLVLWGLLQRYVISPLY